LTVTVNTTADTRDAVPGNGVCEATAGVGNCSLRAAIDEANATVGLVAINMNAGTYTLSRNGNDNTNNGGDLDVTGKVSLAPTGAVTVQMGACPVNGDRLFDVRGGQLSMRSITLQGGRSAGSGGAIRMTAGATNLTFTTVTSNKTAVDGGAVEVTGGTLNVTASTINGNTALGAGGGIHVASAGTASVTNSTVSGNRADPTANVDVTCDEAPTGAGIPAGPAGVELPEAPPPSAAPTVVANPDGLTPVIVELAAGPASRNLDRQADRTATATADFLADAGADPATEDMRVNRTYSYLPMVAVSVDAEGLEALEADPNVVSVYPDIPSAPTLAQSIPWINADSVHGAGYSGSGYAVAVIDTGVDATEPMTAGKVVSEACFALGNDGLDNGTGDCPNGDDSMTGAGSGTNCPWFTATSACWHGTHVASTAAGATRNISGTLHTGVAHGADIIAVNVFSHRSGAVCGGAAECLLAHLSDTIAGLDWVVGQTATQDIAAVNMSLGGGTFTDCDGFDPRKTAIDTLRSLGVATVVSSGNNGSKAGVGAPGCISTAITVGATPDNANSVSGFSQSAPVLDLLAPGENITAEYPTLPSDPGSDYVITANGTSMAAPHVAGAVAVLKAANPGLTVTQIEAALENTGVPIADSNGISRPRIDLEAAMALGLGTEGRGGGIASEGTTSLLYSTVTANEAWAGGGLVVDAGTTTVAATLIGSQVGGGDCAKAPAATLTATGRNLSSDGSCWSGGTNLSNVNPQLGALANNGGPTLTHLPAGGSPARNVIPNGEAPYCHAQAPRDQRLVVRPQGAGCDIGSVEA
jgi:CSLREA domain-containing protein